MSTLNNQFSIICQCFHQGFYRKKQTNSVQNIMGGYTYGPTFKKNMSRIYDLEDRLVEYTCRMIEVVEALPKTRSGNYMAGQLIRSCHSPAFNYGEAQAAESSDDFIHKLRVVLKELKECRTCIKIIIKKAYIQPTLKLSPIYKETEELIAIVGKSISTAEKNKTGRDKK